MIKRLALLTLLATPFLAHAQAPKDEAAAAKAPPQPLVTFDVTGTFPANAPATRFTAPNAAFLLEITFYQTVPARIESFSVSTGVVSASYTFEGQTRHAASGSYGAYASVFAGYDLKLGFAGNFTLEYASESPGPGEPAPYPVWFPLQDYRNPVDFFGEGTAVFTPGDAGAPSNPWHLVFTNPRGQSFVTLVKITDIVGRLIVPAAAKTLAAAE